MQIIRRLFLALLFAAAPAWALTTQQIATLKTACTADTTCNALAVAADDFTKANGDSSGRKVTFGGKTGVTIDASGTPTHVALCKSGDSTLRYVTTATGSALTSGGGNTCSIGSFKIEIADPS